MKKLLIAIIGGTVLLVGVVMLVLPGPGVAVIAAGVAILATEFIWARRVWRKARGTVAKVRRKSGFRAWWQRFKARRNKAGKGSEPKPALEPERQTPDRLGVDSHEIGVQQSRSEVPDNSSDNSRPQTDPTSGCDHGSR